VGPGRDQPSNRVIIGGAVMLFGAVLLGVGIHHLVATGTCSSTGYSANYGPVPTCPSGTGAWFGFVFGGIFLTLGGGLAASGLTPGLSIAAIFLAIGIGSLTIAFEPHKSSGEKVFALVFGGAFTLAGLIPALFVLRSGIRSLGSSPRSSKRSSPFGGTTAEPDAILGAYAAGRSGASGALAPTPTVLPGSPSAAVTLGSLTPPQAPPTSSGPGDDALDKIAKLAELRDKGALTDAEFNREKAKLLAEL
jgi:putative oligomerization/nucleic acid binding protein